PVGAQQAELQRQRRVRRVEDDELGHGAAARLESADDGGRGRALRGRPARHDDGRDGERRGEDEGPVHRELLHLSLQLTTASRTAAPSICVTSTCTVSGPNADVPLDSPNATNCTVPVYGPTSNPARYAATAAPRSSSSVSPEIRSAPGPAAGSESA